MNYEPTEVWFTTTKRGTRRAWYYSTFAGRAFPYPRIDAELLIATGAATEVERPMFVGRPR